MTVQEQADQGSRDNLSFEAREDGVFIEDYRVYPFIGFLMIGWDEIHSFVDKLLELRQEYLRREG